MTYLELVQAVRDCRRVYAYVLFGPQMGQYMRVNRREAAHYLSKYTGQTPEVDAELDDDQDLWIG